jgi:regulator of protease activity HflC (stomatin/prohibitin superfamily)
MTHRIVVNVETGEVTQVEYTPEEQAAYDAAIAAEAAAVAAQQAAEAQQQTQ